MIELSDGAEQMARQTGLGKSAEEMFPGFPALSEEQVARPEPA